MGLCSFVPMPPSSSAILSDMAEMKKFDKLKMKKTEIQEKNLLPPKETIEQKQAGVS
ncbi:thymosin beta-4-like [Suncus etruscus]|uniref:thymosin beta-4-like n=1 Tax=Suncus etruscus TaxID=109475 RepID=UPI002110AFA5|nr:thymosin beta-4-like [Suncus etruscus]